MGRKTKKSSNNTIETSKPSNLHPESIFYEGIRLANLLNSIEREMDSEKFTNTALPEKLWLKQQFSVGVNDVTRVLERMKPIVGMGVDSMPVDPENAKGSSIQLQAILVACDCHPRWLTRHLPDLALSRKVPLIYIRDDNKGGSLRLGKLVKLRTAIAIGVKVKGNAINQIIQEVLEHDKPTILTSHSEAAA